MQLIPKCMNLLIHRNSVSSQLHSVCFHGTPISLAKWKYKWNPDSGRGQQPDKDYMRYTIREKRVDGKKSLKDDILRRYGMNTSCETFEDGGIFGNDARNGSRNFESKDRHPQSGRSSRSRRRAKKTSHGGRKHKKRREYHSDYDVDPNSLFQKQFGARCVRFRTFDDFEVQSFFGFDWVDDNSDGPRTKRVIWNTSSEEETESEDEEELHTVKLSSNRTVLGLPPRGPLKMDEIKSAFRSCALKWHPDKHQGSSQALAEERFKQCSEAYQYLCKELASP